MDTLNILLLVILTILVIAWSVYNFYWLNKPQVYLIYNPAQSFAYNQQNANAVSSSLNAKLATYDQFVESFNNGASTCTFGYLNCTGCTGSCSYCTNGIGIYDMINSNGQVPAGCGGHVGIGGNTVNAGGYWLYGSKPANSQVTIGGTTWTVAPFRQIMDPTVDKEIFNRFEIFGIPKVF